MREITRQSGRTVTATALNKQEELLSVLAQLCYWFCRNTFSRCFQSFQLDWSSAECQVTASHLISLTTESSNLPPLSRTLTGEFFCDSSPICETFTLLPTPWGCLKHHSGAFWRESSHLFPLSKMSMYEILNKEKVLFCEQCQQKYFGSLLFLLTVSFQVQATPVFSKAEASITPEFTFSHRLTCIFKYTIKGEIWRKIHDLCKIPYFPETHISAKCICSQGSL